MLGRDQHSSLLQKFVHYGQKSFYNIGPGACTIKLITAVIYRFSLKVRVLQSMVGPWPYPQTFTRLEKLARDKHSSLLQKFVNYGRDKF
jgi:hypothetical protein